MNDIRNPLPPSTVSPAPPPPLDPFRDELLSSKPTPVLLMKKLIPTVAKDWRLIGVQLGIEASILKACKSTESYDLELCCLEMLEYWLKEASGTGESPRTWSTILSAVGDCLGHDTAGNIERVLFEEMHQRK